MREDEGTLAKNLRTLTGTVSAGVEHQCLLLDGYLLVGGDRSVIRAGARLTVTGEVVPDLITNCQQGTPLMVISVRPAFDINN
ncbi:hypothetical protein Abr02nite_47810 [Paractinoplanes brasiliensis]|nr:hypothetical protein Abr02nite_47810 [Actinoplanes brasiliensis]